MKKSIFILLSVALFNCKSSTDANQQSDSFSESDSWIYSDQEFFGNGQFGSFNIDSLSVVSSTIKNGNKNITLTNATTEVLDPSGKVIIEYSYNFSSPFKYKIPTNFGDTISQLNSIPLKVNGIVYVGSIITIAGNGDTLITVPAGLFHCACFRTETFYNKTFLAAINFRFICPTVGLIKSESYDFDSSSGIRWLADQYQLIKIVK